MVDIGSISFYLGLKVNQNYEKKIFKLPQPKYIDKILAKFYLDQANTLNTPIKKALFTPNEGKEVILRQLNKNATKE